MTEGKLGFIAKFRTVSAAACVTSVAVAYQPRVGRTNPTNGIAAFFQPVFIKTRNLAVGRQVGGCTKNDSAAFLSNNIIGIIECESSVFFGSTKICRKGSLALIALVPILYFGQLLSVHYNTV
ncbi:Uncharacterised protein [Neisseria meningitidis]|nr:Uncharacterised protein [Neisseria meningitidis]CWQ51719.1 Uncharacterised protein [Neisseria meningitidis]